MVHQDRVYSVLIVSAVSKFNESIISLLHESKYSPVICVGSISAAKREVLERDYDIILINSPASGRFRNSFCCKHGIRQQFCSSFICKKRAIRRNIRQNCSARSSYSEKTDFSRRWYHNRLISCARQESASVCCTRKQCQSKKRWKRYEL